MVHKLLCDHALPSLSAGNLHIRDKQVTKRPIGLAILSASISHVNGVSKSWSVRPHDAEKDQVYRVRVTGSLKKNTITVQNVEAIDW